MQHTDIASFYELMLLRFQEEKRKNRKERTDEEELSNFLELVEQSNEKIREMARALEPVKAPPRAVPSTLGLTLPVASGKLKQAGLKLRGVSQEYSARVPEGHVISQAPRPGTLAAEGMGVRLLVSRGAAPEGAARTDG